MNQNVSTGVGVIIIIIIAITFGALIYKYDQNSSQAGNQISIVN
jgi:hypothetical protein